MNKYPCHICGEKMRVAYTQKDPFHEDDTVLIVCDNCYKGTWLRKSTFDSFIKENRVV